MTSFEPDAATPKESFLLFLTLAEKYIQGTPPDFTDLEGAVGAPTVPNLIRGLASSVGILGIVLRSFAEAVDASPEEIIALMRRNLLSDD